MAVHSWAGPITTKNKSRNLRTGPDGQTFIRAYAHTLPAHIHS
jgi:hypothetical protein